MPHGDRTGPMGIGPITGRGAGFCAGNALPDFLNSMPGNIGIGFGSGRGRCFGMGMGRRHGRTSKESLYVNQTVSGSKVDQLSVLKNKAKYFSDTLKSINSKISELESEKI